MKVIQRKAGINIFHLTFLSSFIFFSSYSYACKSEKKINFSINSYNFSEPKSIENYIGGFTGDIYSGNHAISLNSFSIGIQNRNLSLELVERFDYIQSFTNETALFYHQLKNNISTDKVNQYHLGMETTKFEATGIKIGYQHQASSTISLNFAATYYKGKDFNNGELFGEGQWKNPQEFYIYAPATLYSARNDLLAFPKADAQGKGISIDIRGSWQIDKHWKLGLSANDAFSKINWHDALLTNINHWQIYRLNSDGKLDTNPMATWKKTNYTQKLPVRYIADLSYTRNNIEYFSKILKTQYFSHLQIGLEKKLKENKSIEFSWHKDLRALEIGLNKAHSYISLTTDVNGRALSFKYGISMPI